MHTFAYILVVRNDCGQLGLDHDTNVYSPILLMRDKGYNKSLVVQNTRSY